MRSALVGVLSVARPPIPKKRGAAVMVHLEASPLLYALLADGRRVIRSQRQRATIRSALVGVLSVARPPIPSKWGAAVMVHLEASPF